MEFPDGTTPITSNIYVYQGHDYENPVLPPLSSVKMQDGNVYFEEVFVKLGKSITFMNRNKTIEFGYSPQDVISEIGPPEEIYYRHDKQRIHAFAKHERSGIIDQPSAVDYFYNYFSLGIDIHFNGAKHVVQKIIFHTNFPGSKDFNMYCKCNYKILVPHETEKIQDDKVITPDMKFDEIQKIMGNKCSKPLVNANVPFGGTKFFAYKNIIFEVLKYFFV
jgi:hypothetical protein